MKVIFQVIAFNKNLSFALSDYFVNSSLASKSLFQQALSSVTKIFTVIASEARQSQPLRLRHSTSFHMANATLRERNDIV